MEYSKAIELFKNYMEYKKLSVNTMKTYLSFLNNRFKSEDDITAITHSDVALEIMEYSKTHSTQSTNLLYLSLKKFYDVLINNLGVVEMISPAENISTPNVTNKHHIALTEQEVQELIDCSSIREKAIIMTMFSTGIRAIELQNITLTQYQNRNADNEIVLKVTKGSCARSIFLSQAVCQAIDLYLNFRTECDCEFLFVTNQGTQLSTQNMNKILKTVAVKCKFTRDKIEALSNHVLRHTFCSVAINNGNPLQFVSQAMGHASVKTTEKIYWHKENSNVKTIMQNMV